MTTQENQSCGICFSAIDDEHTPRGIIDSCDHIFCEDCILEWSRGTNICPHCRRRFKSITILKKSPNVLENQNTTAALPANPATTSRKPGGTKASSTATNNNTNNKKANLENILRVHKVRTKNLRLGSDDDEELEEGWEKALMPEQGLICGVCLDAATDMTKVVLCDRRACEYRAHLQCVGLDKAPSFSSGEQWFCPEHQRATKNVPQQQEEKTPSNVITIKNNSSHFAPNAIRAANTNNDQSNTSKSLDDLILDDEWIFALGADSSNSHHQKKKSKQQLIYEDEDDMPLVQRFNSNNNNVVNGGKSPSFDFGDLSQSSMLMMGQTDHFNFMNNNNNNNNMNASPVPSQMNNANQSTFLSQSPAPHRPLHPEHQNNTNNGLQRENHYAQIIPSTYTRSQMGNNNNNTNNFMDATTSGGLNKLQQLQLEMAQRKAMMEQRMKDQQQLATLAAAATARGRGRGGGAGRGGRAAGAVANNAQPSQNNINNNNNVNRRNHNNNQASDSDGDESTDDDDKPVLLYQQPQHLQNNLGGAYTQLNGGSAIRQVIRADYFSHPLEHAMNLPSAANYGSQPDLIRQQQINALAELKRRKEGTDRQNLYRRVQTENTLIQRQQEQQQQAQYLSSQQQQQNNFNLVGSASSTKNPSQFHGVRQNSGLNPIATIGTSVEYGQGQIHQKYGETPIDRLFNSKSIQMQQQYQNVSTANSNNGLQPAIHPPPPPPPSRRDPNNANGVLGNNRAVMFAVAQNRLSVAEALEQVGGNMSANAQAMLLANHSKTMNLQQQLQQNGGFLPGRVRQRTQNDENQQQQENAEAASEISLEEHLRGKYFKMYLRHHLNRLNTSNAARSMTEAEDRRAYAEARTHAEVDIKNLIGRFERERQIEVEKARMRKSAQQEAALRELMAFVQSRRLNLESGSPDRKQQQQQNTSGEQNRNSMSTSRVAAAPKPQMKVVPKKVPEVKNE